MGAWPKRKQPCPVCRKPMKWTGARWICLNVKKHDVRVARRKGKIISIARKDK